MIDEIIGWPFYWIILFGCIFFGVFLLKCRLFDFKFLVVLLLSQYVAHSAYFFGGSYYDVSFFCAFFYLIFCLTYKFEFYNKKGVKFFLNESGKNKLQLRWIIFAKLYILIFFFAKFYASPPGISELLLDERLMAQNENKLMFYGGLVLAPAITACIYDWIHRKYRFEVFDVLVFFVVTVGLISSASKSALVPLLFAFLGASSYLKTKAMSLFKIYSLAIVCGGGTILVVTKMFPALDYFDVIDLMVYRIIANTDSLEYIFDANVHPESYPYSGLSAFLPFISGIFGFKPEFSPGVWLHGVRFGVWDGYGPNSGLIMDFYGNFSWFGLLGVISLVFYIKECIRLNNVIGCSFLSISYIAVADFVMFQTIVLFWLFVFFVLSIGIGCGLKYEKAGLRDWCVRKFKDPKKLI